MQRITGHSASEIAHSSGFHGMQGGTIKKQTFAERQQIEQNRKHIQGYHNSQIATRGARSLSRIGGFGRSEGNLSDMRNGYGRTEGEAAKQGYGRTEGRDYVHERYGRSSGDEMTQKRGYGRTAGSEMHSYGRTSDAEITQAKRDAHIGAIGATSIDGTTALMRMNGSQNAPQKPSYRQNIKPDFTH